MNQLPGFSILTTRLTLLVCLVATAFLPLPAAADNRSAPLVAEDFERTRNAGLYRMLVSHRHLDVVRGVGVGGGRALRATYEGFDRGSERIVLRFPLPRSSDEMTLCYDVRFEEDFQFVRGGKLHGLGPVRPVSGGNPMTPEGWSARVNFGRDGGIRSYLYVQDKPGRYGLSQGATSFRFEKGRWHAVSLHVKLNSGPDVSDGFVRIHVDGALLVDQGDLRFRAATGRDTLISQFLFSTFHGGSNPDWAPKKEDGSYATVHAHFDNIAVYTGERVRGEPGACWK